MPDERRWSTDRQLRGVREPEIFAIDSRPLFRSGLARLTGRAIGCGARTLASLEQAFEAVRAADARPRAIVIGVRPGEDPDLLVRRARQLRAPVVLVIDAEDSALIRDALAAGADGCLLSDEIDAETIRATVAAAETGDPDEPAISDRLRSRAEQDVQLSLITARCLEVLRALSDGLHDHEIAWRLGISVSAVRKHVVAAQERLDARTRTQVVAIAARNGLL
jgi:DNA-binding NarL/FixJ family response regulator